MSPTTGPRREASRYSLRTEAAQPTPAPQIEGGSDLMRAWKPMARRSPAVGFRKASRHAGAIPAQSGDAPAAALWGSIASCWSSPAASARSGFQTKGCPRMPTLVPGGLRRRGVDPARDPRRPRVGTVRSSGRRCRRQARCHKRGAWHRRPYHIASTVRTDSPPTTRAHGAPTIGWPSSRENSSPDTPRFPRPASCINPPPSDSVQMM